MGLFIVFSLDFPNILLFIEMTDIFTLFCLGEGLGKNRNGISTAIKPKLKNNRGGLGHDVGEEFTYNWWEHSFNAAASRITVKIEEVSYCISNII
jgi:hypothetical protein